LSKNIFLNPLIFSERVEVKMEHSDDNGMFARSPNAIDSFESKYCTKDQLQKILDKIPDDAYFNIRLEVVK
jgi:hypothetical protein